MTASVAMAQSSVWVVDDDGGVGVDFLQISAAVNAAFDGDTILVREGCYDSVTIESKALVIQADRGAFVELRDANQVGSLIIRELQAEQSVIVRGVHARHGSAGIAFFPALQIESCAGPVLVEDGSYSPAPVGHGTGNADAARVVDSASVTISRCSLDGMASTTGNSRGLISINSLVFLYDSMVSNVESLAGEGAAWVTGGALYASGCQFQVNAIGSASGVVLTDQSPGCCESQLRMGDPATGRFLDCTFAPGNNGESVLVESGESTFLPGSATTFEVSSPAREGESFTLTFQGDPGAFVLLFLGSKLGPGAFLSSVNGPVLIAPLTPYSFGFLPDTGMRTDTFSIDDLGANIEFGTLLLQPVLFGSNRHISAPAEIVILDGTF